MWPAFLTALLLSLPALDASGQTRRGFDGQGRAEQRGDAQRPRDAQGERAGRSEAQDDPTPRHDAQGRPAGQAGTRR